MGAVTRRTGIGEHTLRAWERRFGFPDPKRLPSGHRRYTADQVRRLLLINEALGCGYRAGDVVPLPVGQLEQLLRQSGRSRAVAGEGSPEWLHSVLESAMALDRDSLSGQLRQAAVSLGAGRFLSERIEPLMVAVGEAWARGELQVRHEHFLSEVVEDLLRSLRSPLDEAARGRPIVLSTLPGEQHGLGLQIVALAVSAAGRSSRVLGPETPVDEIVEAAVTVDAAAVGLSISQYSVNDDTSPQITNLRRMLPNRIRLWLGGSGASLVDELPVNLEVLDTLGDLDRSLRQLAD
jgi:DNA-binding transcriptional MerR regulator/methylmalonyl-CoA mutase cobalamin-binding subunit